MDKSGVHVLSSSDSITGITLFDGVNGGAIFTLVSQADGLVGNEVRALRVKDTLVNNGQLVRGDALRSRDFVTVISCLYSVLANARSSGDDGYDGCNDESAEEHIQEG